MKCPVCEKGMTVEDFGGVCLDVCETGCKGIWFDHGELEKLEENNKGLGQALQSALNSPRKKDNNRGQIKCPKCGSLMHAHFYKSEKMVTVDECYSCGGFFLDSGELKVLRENHISDDNRENYIQMLLAFDPRFDEEKAKIEKTINPDAGKRSQAVTNFCGMLRDHFGN